MSVVVAIKKDGVVYLGSDSQVTRGGTRTSLTNQNNFKIWKVKGVDNCLMGHVGLLRDACVIRVMENLVREIDVIHDEVNFEYVVTRVVPKIIEELKFYNYLESEGRFKDMESRYLFAFEDKLFVIGFDGSVIEVDDYSVIDLALVNIEDLKVTVGWTTKAPLVEVRLLNANNKQIGKTQTSESQITFTVPEVGQYTIGVRPIDNNQQYLGEETTLIVVITPTCVEDVATITTKTKKLLRNGQLLIIRDNKMYNVMGQEL